MYKRQREKAEGKEPLVPSIFQSGDLVTLHDHMAKAFNPKYKGEYRIVNSCAGKKLRYCLGMLEAKR